MGLVRNGCCFSCLDRFRRRNESTDSGFLVARGSSALLQAIEMTHLTDGIPTSETSSITIFLRARKIKLFKLFAMPRSVRRDTNIAWSVLDEVFNDLKKQRSGLILLQTR